MICTVTLNASIDKAYRISGGLEVGTVMRVLDCTDTAGGKGLNAARAVATCGERVVATGFVGGNNGRLLCELLQRDGIPEDFVRVTAETRCCVNVLDGNETSTEFLEPGREVGAAEFARMRERLLSLAAEASVVTIDGSVPHGVSPDDYAGLVEGVRNMGTPCILDTSGVLLERGVKAHPTMVKPNTDEIGQILGRKVTSMSEVAEAAGVVESCADESANIIYGQIIDESLDDQVRITVIATGFKADQGQSSIGYHNDLFASTAAPKEPAPAVQQSAYNAPTGSRFADEDYIPDFLKRQR